MWSFSRSSCQARRCGSGITGMMFSRIEFLCFTAEINNISTSLSLSVSPSQPGNYQQTVKRTEDSFQACNDIVTCFQERARVERLYAQQLNEWSNKWKPLVDTSEYCTQHITFSLF